MRGSGSFARLPSGRDPNESRRSRTIQSPSEGKRAFRLQAYLASFRPSAFPTGEPRGVKPPVGVSLGRTELPVSKRRTEGTRGRESGRIRLNFGQA